MDKRLALASLLAMTVCHKLIIGKLFTAANEGSYLREPLRGNLASLFWWSYGRELNGLDLGRTEVLTLSACRSHVEAGLNCLVFSTRPVGAGRRRRFWR